MRIFKRRGKASELSPITDFWRWWEKEGERELTGAIGSGNYGDLPHRISAKVWAIHPELQWETGKGKSAKHALCVTAAGVAELRTVAERWRRASPKPTTMWEYAAARQPNESASSAVLDLTDAKIELRLARVVILMDEQRQVLDVAVFHPEFRKAGANASRQATFLLLDWLLGEDDVERWLGAIDTISDEPAESIPIDELRDIVGLMAAQHVEQHWVVTESTTALGARRIVTARRPARWIDHPLLDLHTEIRLRYVGRRDDGLPTVESLEILREYEDSLAAALGSRGMLLGHETYEGLRVLHFYSDAEDQNARDILDSFRDQEPSERIHTIDPSWKQIQRLT